MTEQTQTTAQRIQDMLDMNFNFYPGPPGVTAKTIAAEIERLTAEVASKQETIDMLLEDERDAFRHERAQLETQLAKARAEVERLRLPAEAWEADEHYGNLLWSLPVERDTAQEEKLQQAATKRRETSDAAHAGARAREATRERRQELENKLESVRDDFRKLTAERNALKAEAERLRPAAEAWRSLPEDVQIDAEVAAAARARAAKVTP